MIQNPLPFEKELVDLEQELNNLNEEIKNRSHSTDSADDQQQRDLNEELVLRENYEKLEAKVNKLKLELYVNLSPFERVQLSRHFDRPFSLDYAKNVFQNFLELKGDRAFREDPAIIGGTALFNDQPVMIVGHQRGRSTADRVYRNFGMPQPEGYRKAERLYKLAEKFSLPLICLIDTQGAYPGLEAEERGQAESIASCLLSLATLRIPTISIVIGEGGSGDALALGLTDKILMLENSCYSVITPEGCASILWKDAQKAAQAAEALKINAKNLLEMEIIDEIVKEPLGGAHRNFQEMFENVGISLTKNLESLLKVDLDTLLKSRYEKYRKVGVFIE